MLKITNALAYISSLKVKCLQCANATSNIQYERKAYNYDRETQSTLRSFLN